MVGAVGVFPFVLLISFLLSFAPGWANWGGLSIQWVFPAGMTVCLFLLMATFGIGVAGFLGMIMSASGQRRRAHRIVLIWLVAWGVITALASVLAFFMLHADAVLAFPNGYLP